MQRQTVLLKENGALDAFSSRLPRTVRLVGPSLRTTQALPMDFYEFEVVSGNACYREGERFYLTPVQARRAYPALPLS
jgi:hypothetical protein